MKQTLRERIAAIEGIDARAISDERDTDDGIWAYTLPGWWNAEAGTHTFHEDTWTALYASIRRDIAREGV